MKTQLEILELKKEMFKHDILIYLLINFLLQHTGVYSNEVQLIISLLLLIWMIVGLVSYRKQKENIINNL